MLVAQGGEGGRLVGVKKREEQERGEREG